MKPATALCALLALAAGPTVAQQEVYLQVTTPGIQRVVLAAPGLESRPGTDPAVKQTFGSALARDLAMTPVVEYLPAERLRLVEVAPGNPQLTRQRYQAAGAQFLLDGTIATAGSLLVTEVRVWDLASGEVAFSRRYQGPVALAAGMAHSLANDLVNLFTGRPGPFLSRIAFISDRSGAKELWVMRWDGSEAQPLTSHRSIAVGPAWSPDGEWLAFTSFLRGQPQLFTLQPTGGYLRPVSTIAGVNSSPSFSPDGRRIAFAAGDEGNTDVYVVDREGGSPHRLTTTRAIETQPAWSPNGRQIAFTSTVGGSPQLYLMDAEGTNVRRLTLADTFADEASWAPDGVRIAYTTRIENRFQIATLDLRNGERTVVSGPGNNESPCWSPDGTVLAFVSDRSGRRQIYVTDPSGQPRQITSEGNNTQPAWVAQVR